jgi:hypothetical protein
LRKYIIKLLTEIEIEAHNQLNAETRVSNMLTNLGFRYVDMTYIDEITENN